MDYCRDLVFAHEPDQRIAGGLFAEIERFKSIEIGSSRWSKINADNAKIRQLLQNT